MKNLTPQEITLISKMLLEAGVKHAALFGSFARGDATALSDVDLLIEFNDPNKSLFDLAALKIQLEEHVGRTVDLITYNSLHPLLRDRIISEQVKIL